MADQSPASDSSTCSVRFIIGFPFSFSHALLPWSAAPVHWLLFFCVAGSSVCKDLNTNIALGKCAGYFCIDVAAPGQSDKRSIPLRGFALLVNSFNDSFNSVALLAVRDYSPAVVVFR